MTMTPRFDDYLQFIAQRNQMVLAFFAVAAAVIAQVWFWRSRRRQLLWMGVAGFWTSLAGLLLLNPPALPRLTLGRLITQPLWYDEAFTWSMARLPTQTMIRATAGDVHPPLWYLIEGAVVRTLGSAEWALRIPALLFAVVSVGLAYWLARSLGYERRAALWGAGLLAVMPAQLYYAQEARMYTLLEAAVLLAAVGLARRNYLLLYLGMVVALWTHNLAVFFVAPIGLIAVYLEARGDVVPGDHHRKVSFPGKSLAIGWATLMTWYPWVRVLIQQVQDVGNGFWIQDCGLGGYLLPLYRLTLGMGIVSFLGQHAVLVSAGLLGLALWAGLANHRGRILLVLTVGPGIALAMVSEIWRPVMLGRVFLVSLPMLCILAAAALARLEGQHRRPILAVLVPMLVLCLAWQSKGTEQYADFAQRIEEQHAGETIYHVNLASYITLSYYLQEVDQVVWPDAGNLEQALTVETQELMGIDRVEAADVDGDLLVVWVKNPLSTCEEQEAFDRALALGDPEQVVSWRESELVTAGAWEVGR